MSKTTLTDGSPVTPDHREIDPATGQQKGYVVLSADERAKGFVRPVRDTYVHEKCGGVTTMSRALAETYARDPGFYSGTFCSLCRRHFPVGVDGEFRWDGTTEKVGDLTYLANDVERCAGVGGDAGGWREGCDDCLRSALRGEVK